MNASRRARWQNAPPGAYDVVGHIEKASTEIQDGNFLLGFPKFWDFPTTMMIV